MATRPTKRKATTPHEPPVHGIYGIDPAGAPLMRVKEVQLALNLRQQAVYDLVHSGDLHGMRRPGSITAPFNVTRASVIAYLARSSQGLSDRDYSEALLHLFRRLPPDLRRTALRKMQEVSPA